MGVDVATFRREIDLFLDQSVSVAGRREIFVAFAQEEFARFEADWRAALNAEPSVERFVDGRKDAPLQAVKIPGGVAVERVQPIGPIVDRALELFDLFTKIVTGDYDAHTEVFINDARRGRAGAEAQPGDEVAIVNLAPFARKAEARRFNDKDASGFSDGLFEGIAAILKQEFRGGGVAIRYAWRAFDGQRLPLLLIG